MRIAAVGDSVNWGQGLPHPGDWNHLNDEKKYILKCVEWLKQEGVDAKLDGADFLAHSGAVIGTASDKRKKASTDLNAIIKEYSSTASYYLYLRTNPDVIKNNTVLVNELNAILLLSEAKDPSSRLPMKLLYMARPFFTTLLNGRYIKEVEKDFDDFLKSVIDGFIKWIFDKHPNVVQALDGIKENRVRNLLNNYKRTFDQYQGEIPDSYPTILSQLDQLKNSESVDLLFINGGPNDIGILSSAGFDNTFQDALKKIDQFASNRVALLLKEARRLCPSALIVYTGYYPALSPESSIPLVLNELADFDVVPSFAYLAYMFPATWVIDLLKITQTPRIKRQGLIFHKRMLGKFREQIGIFNENRDTASPPIIFSPSGFGALNAMWAKQEMVSSIGNDPSTGVTSSRKRICDKVLDSKGYFENKTCQSAYIGHPNERGANTYFKALQKRIDHQLNFSLRKHLEIIDADIKSVRGLKNRYRFIPIRSLRNLTDVLWLDSISINYTINIEGLNQKVLRDRFGRLTTDIPVDINFATLRFDHPLRGSEVMPLTQMFPYTTMLFDFGLPKALLGVINFDNKDKIKDNFVIDPRGQTRVKKLQYISIKLPNFFHLLRFSMQFDISVNGYKFRTLSLRENSFSPITDARTKITEALVYKANLS